MQQSADLCQIGMRVLGMGLVFRANATTGGTEIPAELPEHFRGIRMSSSLLAMEVAVLALAAFFFGLAPALYALIAAKCPNCARAPAKPARTRCICAMAAINVPLAEVADLPSLGCCQYALC